MALAALAARRIGLGRAWQARDTEAASWCPPWRHVALRRSVLTHAADGDARPWTQLLEEVALAFSAEDVQAMLGRKAPGHEADGSAAEQPQATKTPQRQPRRVSPAAQERKAKLEALRNAALQHTGLTKRGLSARFKVLRALVPVLKDEQLLQLRPSVLRELCSEQGASTAAARLVQLRSQHAGLGVLDMVQHCPELLTASGQHSILLGHSSGLSGVAFAQQGAALVSMDDGGELKVWKLQGAPPSAAVPASPASSTFKMATFAIHPDGRHVLVGGKSQAYYHCMDAVVAVLDTETQQWVDEARADASASDFSGTAALAVIPGAADTHLVVSVPDRGAGLHMWELGATADGAPTVRHKGIVAAAHRASRVAAVPGTQSLLTAGASLTLFSNIADSQPVAKYLASSGDQVHSVGVSGDGRLAAAFTPWKASVWDIQTGKMLATLDNTSGSSTGYIACLAISPDGRHVAVGCSCGGLLIFDLQALQRTGFVEQVHHRGVSCLAFSPDGQVLASGGNDKLLRLWDWGELLAMGAQGVSVQPE